MVSSLLKQTTPCEGYLPLDGATCIQVEQCGKVRRKEDKVDEVKRRKAWQKESGDEPEKLKELRLIYFSFNP